MTRVQYFTACTLDGFIADENNSLDWLYEVPHDEEDAFWDDWFPSVGGLVMGATTYEWMLEHAGPDSWTRHYGERPGWVFTHRKLPPIPDIEIAFVDGDVRPVYEEAVARLSGADLWLVGGGDLVGQFHDAGLLDEIILGMTPVTLGRGAPLLPRRITSKELAIPGVGADRAADPDRPRGPPRRRVVAGLIVGLLASKPYRPENGTVLWLRPWWQGISIPQRLLIASALAYGGVFALLLEYGRPGLGIGEGFFVPVILAAAATSAPEGAVAGLLALVLYELAIHQGSELTWVDFTRGPALTRLASYVAAGLVVGFLARRVRRMLAQSLFVLEDLMELAYGRLEEDERVPTAPPRASLE